MKNCFLYLFSSLVFCSCTKNYESVAHLNNPTLDQDKVQLKIDTITSGDISDPPESDLKVFRKKLLKGALDYDNASFDDFIDFPLNIVVKENTNGNTFLTSQGLNKELILAPQKRDDASQKFYLARMPLTGLLMLQTYVNNQKKLVSAGYYTNNPSKTILYAKDGTSTSGAVWTFRKAAINTSAHILENEDILGFDGPEPTMWNVYNKVIGCEGTNGIYFDKYRNQAKQEFEIRPVDDFKFESIEFENNASATLSQLPDFIVSWTYSNGSSLEQSMSTAFAKKAAKTSNFTQQTGLSLNVSTSGSVKVPFLSEFKITTSTTATTSFTYGKSESIEDQQNYNFPIRIAPKTNITAKAIVGRYVMNVNYTATLRGIKTNKLVKIRGVWEGIDCIDVKFVIEERPLVGSQVLRSETLNKIPSELFKFK